MKGLLAPAGLMISTRLINLGVGLLFIPVLIHFLKGEGFGAWAILLAASIAFSTIELGMPATLIRYAAEPLQRNDWPAASCIRSRVFAIVSLAYAAAAVVLFAFAAPLASLVQLPDTAAMSASDMIIFVFLAVATRSVLQVGTYSLYAARRFRIVALLYFLQPFISHCAAIAVAIATGRLDLTLLAFWIGQLAVAMAGFLLGRRGFEPFSRHHLRSGAMREMLAHGFKVQINGWTQVINFQFDKFVIAAMTGLIWVAPYEVANRSVVTLRSVPVSGIDTFLPSTAAAMDLGTGGWNRYLDMTRIAAYSVVVFMLAPLAIAPIALCAWTGETGYLARWTFAFLLVGGAINALSLPAQTVAQAMGRAGIQARAALTSVAINIPLSLVLIRELGIAGGAIGTAIAMITGAAVVVTGVHRHLQWPIAATLRSVAPFWPCLAVSLALAAGVSISFDTWLATIPADARFTKEMRIFLLPIALGLYVACLVLMAVVQVQVSGLTPSEKEFLTARIRFKWFVEYCERRSNSRSGAVNAP